MNNVKSMFIPGAPYAFVSYTHRDEIVPQTLEQIQQVFNIWWDIEMIAGDRWDSEKAMPAIEGCNCVLAFYSHNYLNSEPCRNEIEAAMKNGKKIIPVSVEGLSLNQLITEVETKLDAESEELRKIQKLCTDIGGGEKSTKGNKVLYVDLKNEQWADSLYKSLEQHLKPVVFMREWLEETDEYRIKKEFQTFFDNGIDFDESDETDDTSGEGIFEFLAGLRYAIENKGKAIPQDCVDELTHQLMVDFDFDEYRDVTVSYFTWMLYNMICEIRNIESFMRKNNDFIPDSIPFEERAEKILSWMNDRGFLNGTFNSFYYDNPNAEIIQMCGVVETVEKVLQYMERTYPEAIKVFVLGK